MPRSRYSRMRRTELSGARGIKNEKRRIIGTGLGTSQFVAIGVASALGNLAGWDGDSVDGGEFITSEEASTATG